MSLAMTIPVGKKGKHQETELGDDSRAGSLLRGLTHTQRSV